MNLSAENIDKIRNYLNDLIFFWKLEAEKAETIPYRKMCLDEVNEIKGFLSQNLQ